jgi:hypothetical protein
MGGIRDRGESPRFGGLARKYCDPSAGQGKLRVRGHLLRRALREPAADRLDLPAGDQRFGRADRLGVRRSTVKTHVVSIYRKPGVSNRTEGVERAEACGFLPKEAPRRIREPV